MVVEDHPHLRSLLVKIFRQLGHEIDAFADGEEALVALKHPNATKPDVIILDHLMPRLTGLQMLEKLRADVRFHDICVIVFTAIDDDVLRRQFRDAGANGFILKGSIGIKDFESYLEKFCGGERCAARPVSSTVVR
jgi:CheY-like chemotaxis protein